MVHCLNQYEFLYSYTALEINNSKKNSVVSLSDNSSDSDGS